MNSTITRLRKLTELNRRELATLAQATLFLPRIHRALLHTGLDATRRRYLSNGTVASLGRCDAGAARDIAHLVAVAARYGPVSGSCLSRALTLCRLLQRRGIAAELRIGVRRDAGDFAAHAWVEVCGEVVNDRADVATRFVPFAADFLPKDVAWQ